MREPIGALTGRFRRMPPTEGIARTQPRKFNRTNCKDRFLPMGIRNGQDYELKKLAGNKYPYET
tara:strand:- start:1142 stop:1333 length:192 start_codon:yes stop_codon:yes gene_type:complete